MTELETDTGAVDVIDNVLRMPLEPVQLALLSAIWEPVHDSQSFQTEAWWPTWDFVSRRVYETHPEVTDAAEVLRSLPQVATGRADRASYGLVWWGAAVEGKPPVLDAKVGLTIAGLCALGTQTYGRTTADDLVNVIQQIALADAVLKPNPKEVVEGKHLLSKYTRPLREKYMQKPFEFSDALTVSVLGGSTRPSKSMRTVSMSEVVRGSDPILGSLIARSTWILSVETLLRSIDPRSLYRLLPWCKRWTTSLTC